MLNAMAKKAKSIETMPLPKRWQLRYALENLLGRSAEMGLIVVIYASYAYVIR